MGFLSLLVCVKQPKGHYSVKQASKWANKPNNPSFGISFFFKADVQTTIWLTLGYMVLVLTHEQVLERKVILEFGSSDLDLNESILLSHIFSQNMGTLTEKSQYQPYLLHRQQVQLICKQERKSHHLFAFPAVDYLGILFCVKLTWPVQLLP